ncbi:receptor-like protein kinase HSL1 isoform X2 [Solanum tuberosum]|uniref:receptor-like protein kinase HSL1 isoform X2 n=1 Tax=Solanum tuberosum TaxID=4113 RepID=UPI00073A30B0|nr:PREDICTED: receptor-like protein kinase HSL1 isoform X2 [Solanum tuberosum]
MLPLRYKLSNCFIPNNSPGICPLKEFLDKSKCCNIEQSFMLSGIVPEMLLLERSMKGGLQSDVYEKEKNILLELKQLWGLHQLWDSDSDSSHCSWYGIGCRNGSVTSISIHEGNLLSGTISLIICELKSLQLIDLSSNYIRGEFPTSLYNCSKLEYLDISWNQFHGPLPSDLHRLSRLIHLDIAGNNFSNIPEAIALSRQQSQRN